MFLIRWLQKNLQGVSSNIFVLLESFSFLFSGHLALLGTVRPSMLLIFFYLLLDGLGKKSKFSINVQQGLKNLLNGLVDLSFYWVTITSIFRLSNTIFWSWMWCLHLKYRAVTSFSWMEGKIHPLNFSRYHNN